MGHHAEHVTDIGPGDATDDSLRQYALKHDAVIVTKDEDFTLMFATPGETPAIVWIRIGNTRKSTLLDWFSPLVPQIVSLIEGGQKLIELR
ncbi:DUF5615 family PIN-like protein [Gordonia phthalatica]|uniref:DUF5615 family PIN-like protein n=1 Tax=Gordonia phthalatica TaxID=1136941 RepID=UPI000AEEC140|nr:DUF5615 family PIN-like protein [Gordonia phthalatica]